MTDDDLAPNQLWPSPPWKLRIRHHDAEKELRMDRPFALLGRHEWCDARVGGARGPELAYLICAFPQSIEAWPLAAIAFPRWGVIQPHHELLIGSHRVTVEHPQVNSDGPIVTELPPLAISTSLYWDNQPHSKIFRRQVTIIGESHPSVMRLHGRGLHPCDQAAIVHDGCLWLVDLVPEHWGSARTPTVRRLASSGDSTRLGDITIQMLGAIARQSLPPEVANLGSLSRGGMNSDSSVIHDALSTEETDGGSDSDLLGTLRTSQSDATVFGEAPSWQGRSGSHHPWKHPQPKRSQTGESGGGAASSDADRQASAPIADAALASWSKTSSDVVKDRPKSEQLTARVTERLVSINQSRFLRRRLLWAVACLLGFLIALLVLWRLVQDVVGRWFEA